MAGGPGQVAKAAMAVYDQWEREWVTHMQKNDQRMTHRDWLWTFVQVAEKFRAGSGSTCEDTICNASCLGSHEFSEPVHADSAVQQ